MRTKMKPFLLLFLALFVSGINSSPDEDRLLKRLFDPDYQTHNLKTTPVSNINETINVTVGLEIRKIIALDELEEVLKLQYWMYYKWVDYRLTWNGSDFGNLDWIYVPAKSMWIPELLLNNIAKLTDENEITPESNYVFISENGTCVWEPRYELSVTQCPVDVTWFPFDRQVCDLAFESWLLNSTFLNLVPDDDAVDVSSFLPPDAWHLTGSKSERGDTIYSYPAITFKLYIRRKPLYYIVNLVIPCCLLSFITLTTFLLPPASPQRPTIAMQILLAMTVYQIIISDKLPVTSASVPVIVVYFLFLIVMCVLAVLATTVVHHLHCRSQSKPFAAMPIWTRNLFCKRLAACLCATRPSSSSPESRVVTYRNVPSVDTGNSSSRNDFAPLSPEATEPPSTALELTKNEMKNDWMLAAAVLNHICAIAFAVVLVGGTLAFFLVFAIHP